MKQTVLLTGGAGFIGSHLTEAFLKEGYRVVVVDNLFSGKMENLQGVMEKEDFHFCNVDIRDSERLKAVFEEYRPQIINHHAAQKSVPYSVENPLYDVSVNGVGLLNLVNMASAYHVETFIYISSGGALTKEIHGDEKSVETDMPQLMSPYAINKFAGEKYMAIYSPLGGFRYMVLRYANVYGPRQIADGECGVIPIFVNNIMAGKGSVLMTYADMPRGCTRDYVYVSDVVSANLLAMKKPVNEVVNIASGKEEYIMDIYDTIQKVFETDYPLQVTGPRAGDVRRSVLNADKAFQVLGWKQTVKLEEGIRLLKDYVYR